ncbi:hypothetical protein OPV22_008007 [Ensete ventricosum]|uniref:chitinase n=1 Tax=Ensete ventricosum TaxID=4639 RepID=A0AAV8PNB6_ENSVE|nr:hypothetical protein OPV22_008007 [Ensete ventricosum]
MRLLVGCGLGIGAVGSSFFDQMLKQRNPFYKYDASIAAAISFGGFGTTGDAVTRTSEIAAFLEHKRPTKRLVGRQRRRTAHLLGATTHQITADGGRSGHSLPGRSTIYGREPMQISYSYDYRPAGQAIGVGLLNKPHLVATDSVVSFKTAL